MAVALMAGYMERQSNRLERTVDRARRTTE